MADDRDLPPAELPEEPDETADLDAGLDVPVDEEYGLRSDQEFDQALETLDTYPPAEPEPEEADTGLDLAPIDEEPADDAATTPPRSTSAVGEEEERLRQPRAQLFRRRLRNQVGMLPLALLFVALGGTLIARQQGVESLPDFSDRVMVVGSLLIAAACTVFHSLVAGRRERGLLFVGLLVWSAAAILGVVIYGIDKTPDAAVWWPVLLVAFGVALVLTFLIERSHDARLLLWAIMVFVAAGTAFAVTDGRIRQDALSEAADWWPLLLAVAGIGLLPLAFRRRTG